MTNEVVFDDIELCNKFLSHVADNVRVRAIRIDQEEVENNAVVFRFVVTYDKLKAAQNRIVSVAVSYLPNVSVDHYMSMEEWDMRELSTKLSNVRQRYRYHNEPSYKKMKDENTAKYITKRRAEDPEFRERQKVYNRNRQRELYRTNPEFRERAKSLSKKLRDRNTRERLLERIDLHFIEEQKNDWQYEKKIWTHLPIL
jgi:hypothetical protein